MWSVQQTCSSTETPTNFIEDDLFMPQSLIFKTGKRQGKLSLSWILWKSVNVVLSSFKYLLTRSHSEIFKSSKFVFFKKAFYHCSNKVSLCQLQPWLTWRYLIPGISQLYKIWRVVVLKLTLMVHHILSLIVLFFHYYQ